MRLRKLCRCHLPRNCQILKGKIAVSLTAHWKAPAESVRDAEIRFLIPYSTIQIYRKNGVKAIFKCVKDLVVFPTTTDELENEGSEMGSECT